MNIAFIGCGRRGRFHMAAFSDTNSVNISGVFDPFESARNSAADQFGSTAYSSVDQLIDSAEPDGIVVATPAHLNAEAALHVLSYGIPTLIEKPPGLSSDDARRLLTAAQKKSTNVMVGLDRRFNPLVTESLARVRRNGPVVQIAGEFHKDIREFTDDPRFSQDIFNYMMLESPIHALDLVCFAAGSNVSKVSGYVRQTNSKYRDVHAALIEFENGVVAQFAANYTTGGRLERYEIHGREISAYLEGVNRAWVMAKGESHDITLPTQMTSTQIQDNYFIECIRSGKKFSAPAATLEDGVKLLELAEAIYGEDQNS